MAFEFYTASKIVLKQGALDELGANVQRLGKNFFLVIDPVFDGSPLMQKLIDQLDSIGAKHAVFTGVTGEPDVETVDAAYAVAKDYGCDAVISLGGGSGIDVGKCVAALITNGPPVIDYLEVVGKGKKVVNDPVPFVAIPTTAGTGSEVTKNCVIGSKTANFKRSMRDDKMVANIALIDPAITVNLPKPVTARSGIDAMTHLIESYITWRHTPIADGLSLAGMELAGKYLQRAYEDGSDMEAREGMSTAALLGGMAFANSGLGAAHGIGMAVGIQYHVGHGEACGIVLPYVMRLNAPATQERMDRVGEALTGKRFSTPGDGSKAAVDFIFALNEAIGIPKDYKHLNIPADAIPGLAKASFGTSMTSNPVQLEVDEWVDFFREIM